jgi:DNA-binding transcriptional LysR family regulator
VRLNRLDLNKFHVFTVAARSVSFSSAATELGLSRSAISQAIASLEASLDARLFDRVGRRIFVSEAGRQLFALVSAYQQGLERGLDDLVALDPARVSGVARVGLFIGFSNPRLAGGLAGFLERYPRAAVKVAFLPHADLAARLLDRKLDFTLSIYPLAQKGRPIESTRFFNEELILVSGPKHHVKTPTLQRIRQLPFVDYHEHGELVRSWIRHQYGTDPGSIRVRAHAAAVDLVLDLILHGVGAGIVPRHVVRPLLKGGTLLAIQGRRKEMSDSIWLNQIQGVVHSAAGARLLEAVRSWLSDAPK